MMLGLDQYTDSFQGQNHFASDVLLAVHRRNGEIAFLVTDFVAKIRILDPPRVPAAFNRVDVIVPFVLVLIETDVVKDKEFRFRAEVGYIGDSQASEVIFRLPGNVARIPRIILSSDGIADVANDDERLGLEEGIDEGGFGHRLDQHVRFIDRLPPSDARPVEANPVFKSIFIDFPCRNGEVLPQTREVHEP